MPNRLPKAVADAAALSEELVKQSAENIDELEEEVIEEEETQVDEPEEELEPEEPTLEEEEEEESTEEAPEADEVDYKELYEKEQHKLSVLQGKYNSEIPRMAQQLRDLEAQAEQSKKKEIKEVSDIPEELNLSPDDFEEYGDEFIQLVKLVNKLKERNEQLESMTQNINADSASRARETFESVLDAKCPDWRDLNHNTKLIEWLQQEEGITGKSKQFFLDDAAKSLNAKAVAKIFNQFKKEFNLSGTKKKKKDLAREVEPSGKSTGGTVPSKAKKQYTRQDIKDFYRKKADGKISDKKAAQIEKDIFLANQEGRIR